jgi:hypothetical protein
VSSPGGRPGNRGQQWKRFDETITEYTKQKTTLLRRWCLPWQPERAFNKQSVHVDVSGDQTKKCRMGGRAIAQAVSRRLPTAAARVGAQVRSCGICGGLSGTGEGFIRVLPFPLPILIPPTAPYSSAPTIQRWYNRPDSGRRTKWTQSHPTLRWARHVAHIRGRKV